MIAESLRCKIFAAKWAGLGVCKDAKQQGWQAAVMGRSRCTQRLDPSLTCGHGELAACTFHRADV